jgi:type I restriction enzyme, S subunit
MSGWPTVKLGEVLRLCDSSVPSSKLGKINLAGVYSFGRGLFRRGPISPADTTYKYYNRLVTDDFVISQPKAWEGALARVTPEFDGWFLSPVFPTFRVERTRLSPSYLEWFCKLEPVWHELQRNSRGMGARRESVSSDQFLSLEIPLPLLKEQQRVVARIEELAEHLNQVHDLRTSQLEDGKSLLSSAFNAIVKGVPFRAMKDVAPIVRRPVTIHVNAEYHELGIRSFGRGTFHKPPVIDLRQSRRLERREPLKAVEIRVPPKGGG